MDVHQNLGPRLRCLSLAKCTESVFASHPGARIEEREGRECFFWLDDVMVAHAWPLRGYSLNFWVRMTRSGKQMLKNEAFALS